MVAGMEKPPEKGAARRRWAVRRWAAESRGARPKGVGAARKGKITPRGRTLTPLDEEGF